MHKDIITHHSQYLNRDMTVRTYGHAGTPFIVFPCQDAMSDNFENFGMLEELHDWIEEGIIRLFCVDTVDVESWSDVGGDKKHRIEVQEAYFKYVIKEALPLLYDICGKPVKPYLTGCSLGATHSAIFFFRRPDLFEGVIALSGCYDTYFFWDGWHDSLVYDNSPVHFLAGMPKDHPYIDLYNQKKMVICVGQGAWEEEGIRTAKLLRDTFADKGIRAWVDLWGYDVNHDWVWWRPQYQYFLPLVLGKKPTGNKA